MRLRPEPTAATWLLKLFCSSPEHESVIGDLLEQYQRGRGRFWCWRQVIAIVFLGLYREVRRLLASPYRIPMRQGLDRPMNDDVKYHRGISMHHIPVEGAVGLLFVFATALIFGVGIRAVREMLVVTMPLGIL